MKALLDTCILSELRNPNSTALLEKSLNHFNANHLFISVISVGEITKGIDLLPPSKKKTSLKNWAIRLENNYKDRILNVDCEIAHIWGELTSKAQQRGKKIPVADGLIAATALAHGLHLMTRNISDFKSTGVLIFNPWS